MKMLQVYTDFVEDLEPLTDAEIGRLFLAMLKYAADETEPDLMGNERITWATARKHIRAQWAEYRMRCERNKENISKRYDPLRQNTTGYDQLPNATSGNKNKNNTRIKQEQYISKEKDIERESATERVKRMLEAM